MDTDADLDAAAEDPPAVWLALAVAGLVLTGAGVVVFVLDLLGVTDSLVTVVPLLAPLVGLSPVVAILGVGLFVFAMTRWSPDLDS